MKKKLMAAFLAICIIFILSSSAFASERKENISNSIEYDKDNELSIELSKYFTKDERGNISFNASKYDLYDLGISNKDAEIMLSFSSKELNEFAESIDNSLVINNTTNNTNINSEIQLFGFVGVYLKLGPKVRSMAAIPAGAFAAGFVGWYLKDLAKSGPWEAGVAAAISASVGGIVGWAVKNHLKTVPVGRNIPGVSWSRNVYIP